MICLSRYCPGAEATVFVTELLVIVAVDVEEPAPDGLPARAPGRGQNSVPILSRDRGQLR